MDSNNIILVTKHTYCVCGGKLTDKYRQKIDENGVKTTNNTTTVNIFKRYGPAKHYILKKGAIKLPMEKNAREDIGMDTEC